METPADLIESLVEKAEAYGKTTYELATLKALETVTVVVTSLVSRLSIILVISLSAFVFNIGVALLLGDLLGETYYGFFIVAAFYLLLGVVLLFFMHKWIKKPVSDLIISQTFQKQLQ